MGRRRATGQRADGMCGNDGQEEAGEAGERNGKVMGRRGRRTRKGTRAREGKREGMGGDGTHWTGECRSGMTSWNARARGGGLRTRGVPIGERISTWQGRPLTGLEEG